MVASNVAPSGEVVGTGVYTRYNGHHFPLALLTMYGIHGSHLIQYFLGLKSLHTKHDLDPFSSFCMAQARDIKTYRRHITLRDHRSQ